MSMSELADLINVALLSSFTACLAASAYRIIARALSYRRRGQPIPRLLPRDLVLVGGLLVPFATILLARSMDWAVRGNLVWQLATGIPAVAAVAVFTWYEFRVIDQ
jgi:hypothetical protein